MLDSGKVVKIENNLTWVEFTSSAACEKCGACQKDSFGKMINEVRNLIHAKVGDLVEVKVSSATYTLFPFLAFGLPIIFFFIGLAVGNIISEIVGISAGIVFLAIGFFAVKLIDKYLAKQKKFMNRIIRVLNEQNRN